eukprot:1180396-Prorocentrum_minimum.AAC.7
MVRAARRSSNHRGFVSRKRHRVHHYSSPHTASEVESSLPPCLKTHNTIGIGQLTPSEASAQVAAARRGGAARAPPGGRRPGASCRRRRPE